MTRYNRVQLSPTEKKSEVKGLGRFLGAFLVSQFVRVRP